MKTYLSLGAGVDTTAILLMPDVMKEIDFVLFADTGGENPETYDYMDKHITPYLEKIHKPLITVHGEERVNGKNTNNMEEAYLGWKMIPVRFMRHCFQVLIDDILIELVLFLFTGGRRIIHYFYLSRARRNKINSNKGEIEENNEVQ